MFTYLLLAMITNVAWQLANGNCFRNCCDVCEQDGTANSVREDDWTAELTIIASHVTRCLCLFCAINEVTTFQTESVKLQFFIQSIFTVCVENICSGEFKYSYK